MTKHLVCTLLLTAACQGATSENPTKDDIRSQGKADDGHDWCEELGWYGDGICDDFCLSRDQDCATDDRVPELKDPRDVLKSAISMEQGLAQTAKTGPVIEAKFEPDDSGNLSLSTYPVKSLALDAERNVFQEMAGDPTTTPWTTGLETFHDFEHLTRSTRDLTLRQLSAISLESAVHEAAEYGDKVYWAIPTIQEGRAGYGIWSLIGSGKHAVGSYQFVDGQGSGRRQTVDLGAGPGSGATDARTPELGSDVTVARQSKIKMSTALRQVLKSYPQVIEAKFEIGDDGKLSLSIYPTKEPVTVAAEKQTFFELAGDPTADAYAPSETKFDVPDEEHLTRSARDLTLVQTSSLTLLDAVMKAEFLFGSGSFVYWAIPTMRGTRAGYGIYVLDANNKTHYLFIS